MSVLQTVCCGESQRELEPDRVQAAETSSLQEDHPEPAEGSEGGGCLEEMVSRIYMGYILFTLPASAIMTFVVA